MLYNYFVVITGKEEVSIMKKIVVMFFATLLLFIFVIILPIRLPEKPSGKFNETRVLVDTPLWTGPEFSIVKGEYSFKKYFSNKNPKVQTYELTAEGNHPLQHIDPAVLTEGGLKFILYGRITGTKEIDGEIVPVFYVENWRPVSYITFFDHSDIKIFFYAYLCLCALLFFEVIAIFIMLIRIFIKKYIGKPKQT